MKVTASLNYLRLSPRKVRVVVDAVRGMGARDATVQLSFLQRRAAQPVRKLISSAIANAEHNFSLDPASLKIASITVNEGPTLKRFKAKAQGRAALIEHKTSHVTVVLEGERAAGEPKKKEKVAPVAVEEKPRTSASDIAEAPKETEEKSLRTAEKKMGKEKKESFAKRIFRRKSI